MSRFTHERAAMRAENVRCGLEDGERIMREYEDAAKDETIPERRHIAHGFAILARRRLDFDRAMANDLDRLARDEEVFDVSRVDELVREAERLRQRAGFARLRFGATPDARVYAACSTEHEERCTADTFESALTQLVAHMRSLVCEVSEVHS